MQIERTTLSNGRIYAVTFDTAQRVTAIVCIVNRRGKEHRRHLWQEGELMTETAASVLRIATERQAA
jgi:hypothetical protein